MLDVLQIDISSKAVSEFSADVTPIETPYFMSRLIGNGHTKPGVTALPPTVSAAPPPPKHTHHHPTHATLLLARSAVPACTGLHSCLCTRRWGGRGGAGQCRGQVRGAKGGMGCGAAWGDERPAGARGVLYGTGLNPLPPRAPRPSPPPARSPWPTLPPLLRRRVVS